MTDRVYYFDGEDSCSRCQASTGYYLEMPERPHDHCDCEIEEIELEDLGGVVEYRNVSVDETETLLRWEHTEVNEDGSSEESFAVEFDMDEDNDLDDELREAAEAEGWSPRTVVDLSFEADIPPYHVLRVWGYLVRFETYVFAEKWLVVETPDGDTVEQFLTTVVGHHGRNIDLWVTEDIDELPEEFKDQLRNGPLPPDFE